MSDFAMRCRLLRDPPASGDWNMAVDEALLESAAGESQGALRFYAWRPATLSLGYFQQTRDRRRHAASRACDIVRRPSGGGAILHDDELTYCLVTPARHPLSRNAEALYQAMHRELVAALRQWSITAQLCEEGRSAPPR